MDKYIDNKLAEEMDLIVLTNDSHVKQGLPKGSVGTLIDSYTGHDRPIRRFRVRKRQASGNGAGTARLSGAQSEKRL